MSKAKKPQRWNDLENIPEVCPTICVILLADTYINTEPFHVPMTRLELGVC